MVDISVEYAHIYTNNKIGEEQKLALTHLSAIKQKLDDKSKTYSFIVLVDDYSFPDPTFDYDSFVDWLESKNFKPDFLYRESQLIPICDEVLALLENKKLKSSIVDYIKSKKKYPCSLFIAAWYLLRLGALEHNNFSKDIVAKKLLNILPESFKPFEDDGLKIIAATQYADYVSKIEYEFIEGRLVA